MQEPRFQQIFSTLIFSSSALIAGPLMAQQNVAPGIGGVNAPMGLVTQTSPGTYNFEQYQKSQVFQDYMNNLNSRNNMAAQLYQDSVKGYFAAFNDLQNYANDKLIIPAISSLTSTGEDAFLTLKKYALAVQGYKQLKRSVELKIASISGFTNALSARIETDAPGLGVNSVPTITAGLDFSKISKEFTDKLQEIESQLKTQQIRILDKIGAPQIINLLDLTLANKYTEREINSFRDQIIVLRSLNSSQKTALTAYSNQLILQISNFITTYGTQQSWRWNVNKTDYTQQKEQAAKEIFEAFANRSYLRMYYGLNLGLIAIKYDLKAFGIDRFWNNLNHLEFYPISRASADVNFRENAIAELMKASESKGESMSRILKGEVGFVHSVNSTLAAIMGQDETAKALKLIVTAIINDMYEEKIAMEGKRTELLNRYKAQYYTVGQKNETGWDDRALAYKRELEFDFSEKKMNTLLANKLIPERIVRMNTIEDETLMGYGQKALSVAIAKLTGFANAVEIQAIIDTHNDSIKEKNGQSDIDKMLGY